MHSSDSLLFCAVSGITLVVPKLLVVLLLFVNPFVAITSTTESFQALATTAATAAAIAGTRIELPLDAKDWRSR